jgi:AmiR/NasT family two-component response regulator
MPATTVLLLKAADPAAPDLAADLRAAGFAVAGEGDCAQLLREALRSDAGVLVCWAPRPEAQLFDDIAALQSRHPLPVLVFTQDTGAESMQRALEAGVHGWVVQGYARERVRPLVQLAIAREARERQLRGQVDELGRKLEERKLVDQAKGLLMRASQVSEQEAFQLLRTASMQGNLRMGEVSRHVVEAARAAQAINRAGQQRMLSQRMVKLYALAGGRGEGPAAQALLRESVARVEDNLAALRGDLSGATYGDLLAAATEGWKALRAALEAPPQAAQLARVDALAETVLQQADTLVQALAAGGQGAPVGVVNTAGRQRMLSQRVAKLALLGSSAGGAGLDEAVAQFEAGLSSLRSAPLSTPDIRSLLADGEAAWELLRAALPKAAQPAGRKQIAAASEALLELFDRLTDAYEHSIQLLMGG